MGKVLIILYQSFSEFEITVATAILKNGYEVITSGRDRGIIVGESGLKFIPHITFNEINVDEYKAVIIPGGDLNDIMDDEILLAKIKDFYLKGKILGAICNGPYVLGEAGVLNNRLYTVTLTDEQRYSLQVFNENNFRYENVVESGNVITAQGHAFVEFGLKLGERLGVIKNLNYRKFFKGIGNPLMEPYFNVQK